MKKCMAKKSLPKIFLSFQVVLITLVYVLLLSTAARHSLLKSVKVTHSDNPTRLKENGASFGAISLLRVRKAVRYYDNTNTKSVRKTTWSCKNKNRPNLYRQIRSSATNSSALVHVTFSNFNIYHQMLLQNTGLIYQTIFKHSNDLILLKFVT